VLAVLVFVVGLYPQPLFDVTDTVSQVLFAS
jgi:NADH:ubiquinone oxidoreductase subunit 4 (subunit M)